MWQNGLRMCMDHIHLKNNKTLLGQHLEMTMFYGAGHGIKGHIWPAVHRVMSMDTP